MPLFAKVGSTWEVIAQPYAKVGTVWEPIKNIWAKVGSTWELVYTAMVVSLSPTSLHVNVSSITVCGWAGTVGTYAITIVVTGGTAPINMTLTRKSGTVFSVFNGGPQVYGSNSSLSVSNDGAPGSAVFTVTATDANGVIVGTDFTITAP